MITKRIFIFILSVILFINPILAYDHSSDLNSVSVTKIEQLTSSSVSSTNLKNGNVERNATANDQENTLLFSVDDIFSMTKNEFAEALRETTPLNDYEIDEVVNYYHSENYNQGIMPTYGIYDFPEWDEPPVITDSVTWVAYSTNWIGIDAYRSSVGMKKSKTESLTISFNIGFEGSAEIKKIDSKFELRHGVEHTITMSEEVECPAWTTVNWRPYAVYREDKYEGVMKVRTIAPTVLGVYEYVWYDPHEATNRVLITQTTETWSRYNENHSLTAATPLPPTTAPSVY